MSEEKKLPHYEVNPETDHVCLTHRRRATHLLFREGIEPTPNCDPNLGGIMACCKTVRYEKLSD